MPRTELYFSNESERSMRCPFSDKHFESLNFPVYIEGFCDNFERMHNILKTDINVFELAAAVRNIVSNNDCHSMQIYGKTIDLALQNNYSIIEIEKNSSVIYFDEYPLIEVFQHIYSPRVVKEDEEGVQLETVYYNEETTRLVHYFLGEHSQHHGTGEKHLDLNITYEDINSAYPSYKSVIHKHQDRVYQLKNALTFHFKHPIVFEYKLQNQPHLMICGLFDLIANLMYDHGNNVHIVSPHPYIPQFVYDIQHVHPIRTALNENGFSKYFELFRLKNHLTFELNKRWFTDTPIDITESADADHTLYSRLPVRILLGDSHELVSVSKSVFFSEYEDFPDISNDSDRPKDVLSQNFIHNVYNQEFFDLMLNRLREILAEFHLIIQTFPDSNQKIMITAQSREMNERMIQILFDNCDLRKLFLFHVSQYLETPILIFSVESENVCKAVDSIHFSNDYYLLRRFHDFLNGGSVHWNRGVLMSKIRWLPNE